MNEMLWGVLMKKVAMLFGIDDYPQCKLNNAVNDAAALSCKLQELGFDTKCCSNIDAETMHRELIAFKAGLENASVGLFFFAGHGIQCKGENYLATVDTSFEDEISCRHTAIPLNEVIDIFEASKVNTKILILDACRDNPFAAWRSVYSDGLAPVYAPKGTIIAFSTSPGQKASDGINGHGVFTNALLMHIGTKKLSIEDMFKRVRNTVSSHTNHKQITWEHTSLMGTYYFNSGYDDGVLQTVYSEDALADERFTFKDESGIQSIVEALKSHNWYKQNPAISRIKTIRSYNSEKDELFVLGRNIYQAACGSSSSAIDWINNIESRLGSIGGNEAIHILNGVLFEIYFSSTGQLRKNLKAKFFEKPVKLCQRDEYLSCASFIRSFLEQHIQRVIYLPGTSEILNIDIILEKNIDYQITEIYIDGLACMYNEDGLKYFDFHKSVTKSQLEYLLSEMIAVPMSKKRITFSIEPDANENIQMPNYFQILRYVP